MASLEQVRRQIEARYSIAVIEFGSLALAATL